MHRRFLSIAALVALAWNGVVWAESASSRNSSLSAARRVDELLASETSIVASAPEASDEVFLRRAYFDFVGRSPSADDVTLFALDKSANKRQRLIDRLLNDPRFGENWGRYWRDVIMYRRSDERGLIASLALFEYLQQQFNSNAPWDETARAFITATGDVREQGATGLVMAQDGDTTNITSEVARIFLGIQIQCAQCHDHKTDRWTRTQFHELAAFFPRITVRPSNEEGRRSFVVVGNDRPRQARQVNRPIGQPEHFMPDLDDPAAPGTKMQPRFFLTGQAVELGTQDTERRQAVAEWITAKDNPWFAKAFVNRVWGELIGAAFYEPIDDLGPDRECVAPQTLDYLAQQFVSSAYDVKQLYCTIANTKAYQREIRAAREHVTPAIACAASKRLRGDQLYDALEAVLGPLDPGAANRQGRFAETRGARGQVNQAFGFDPSTPADELAGSIPQALMLMNGPRINRAMDGRRSDSELAKLLTSTTDNETVTVELYLKCFAREPNRNELQKCLGYVKRSKDRAEAFEDILWALVNSAEFFHRD